MKIFVVRHGETTWNKEGVFRGRKDVPLNETGLWQAERTGAFFSRKGLSAIYSSPLARTIQTASLISQSAGVPVTPDDAFIDMEFGLWDGLSLASVGEGFPELLDTWRYHPQRFRLQGAETLARVRKRVVDGLRRAITHELKHELKNDQSERPTHGLPECLTDVPANGLAQPATGAPSEPVIVIVTHRVICKLLALHFLGVPNRFFWKVNPTLQASLLLRKRVTNLCSRCSTKRSICRILRGVTNSRACPKSIDRLYAIIVRFRVVNSFIIV